MSHEQRNVSWLWYLFPVFFHFIGGAVAYFMLKPTQPRIAKDCMCIGIVISAVNFATLIIILALGLSFEELFKSELYNDLFI